MPDTRYNIVYLILINLFSFILFYVDKQKSIKGKWRIKESTLHAAGLMGGIIGSIAAMILFHHKTKKPKFIAITIIALLFNAFLAYEFIVNL